MLSRMRRHGSACWIDHAEGSICHLGDRSTLVLNEEWGDQKATALMQLACRSCRQRRCFRTAGNSGQEPLLFRRGDACSWGLQLLIPQSVVISKLPQGISRSTQILYCLVFTTRRAPDISREAGLQVRVSFGCLYAFAKTEIEMCCW